MNNKKKITASFTGHRNYDNSCEDLLREEIERLYQENFRIFLCGMARGFDLAAGECVASLREKLPELQLCCIIPFRGQERSFSKVDRERYLRLIEQANQVIVLAESFQMGAYHTRNNYLVDNSSAIIAYYNGTKGGTHYTLRRAIKQGLRISNLCLFRDGELFYNFK
jgi:uncharacterized phage-like protein YoqJ